MLEQIAASPGFGRDSQLVFLGDYVDRGGQSAGVIDLLASLDGRDNVHCLTGNHEIAMLNFLSDPVRYSAWLDWGGDATILSYGVRAPHDSDHAAFVTALRDGLAAAMPDHHLRFLRGLKSHLVIDETLYVHAGIRPGVPLAEQSLKDMTEIRAAFLNHRGPHPYYVVHGHTPVSEPEILDNRADIDTGAFASGRLTCLIVEDGDRRLL